MIILATVVGYDLFSFGAVLIGFTNPASVYAKIGYLLLVCTVLIPLLLWFFAYRNFKCIRIEWEVEVEGCFSSAKQRKIIIVTTVIDFFLAVAFLSLAIVALFYNAIELSIRFAALIIEGLMSVVSGSAAISKISIIKLPVIPQDCRMPYNDYPWDRR